MEGVTIWRITLVIKEFANKAGVSTQAIYQQIEKDLKGFVKVENGKKDKQIAKKDRQLKDLTSALITEQQSAQQAQALHAGTIKQTALIESDTRKNNFWTKLFEQSKK